MKSKVLNYSIMALMIMVPAIEIKVETINPDGIVTHGNEVFVYYSKLSNSDFISLEFEKYFYQKLDLKYWENNGISRW